jgi:hypothetical protein
MFHSSVKAPPTEVLPGVNTLVRLQITVPATDGSGTLPLQLPSRVEDVDRVWPLPQPLLYVAAPRYPGDLEGPEPGSPCQVAWPTPVGLFELPTRFEGRVRVGPAVRAWRLSIDGPVVRAQRRRYFRVPWIGPVTLEVRRTVDADGRGEELQVLTGSTVDLSEGGLRCTLPAPGVPDGTPLRVLLPVHEQILVLPATAVWHRPAASPASRLVEVGISFDDVEEHGDLLRQVVIDEQLHARRLGLG